MNVREHIIKFISSGNRVPDSLDLQSRLDYIQERRTAAILQNAPEITKNEFKHGDIKNRTALLIIGLSHMPNIIKYLDNRRITIPAPLFCKSEDKDYNADLNLMKGNFGVSIILPRTLEDDQKILEMNGLGKVMTQYHR